MFYRLIVTFVISSFCLNVFAKNPDEAVLNYQSIPKSVDEYPDSDFSFYDEKIKWNASNNLRRKTGSAFLAIGELLIFEGYIFDVNNVPIDNVQIKLIHANSNGAYNHDLTENDALYDANFTGNGIAVTDNRGYFSFVTIFPGHYGRRAPHLHVSFKHPKYDPLETEIFFSNHPRNKADFKYKNLTVKERKGLTADVFFIDVENKNAGKRAKLNLILNINQENKQL